MTAEAPLGEWVEVDVEPPNREAKPAAPPPERPPDRELPTPAGWHDSTAELMRGVVVTDETDSMPGELFERLFLESEPARPEGPAPRVGERRS